MLIGLIDGLIGQRGSTGKTPLLPLHRRLQPTDSHKNPGLHGEDSEHSVRHDFLGTYSGKKEKRTELISKTTTNR